MNKKRIAIFILSLVGVLFSGYMGVVKLFTDTCALGETCPYFLGYPSCYFGFGLFLVLFVFSWIMLKKESSVKSVLPSNIFVSFLGVLFAGYYTLGEIPLLFEEGLSAYFFGLPTCAIGFVFFMLVFILSLGMSARVVINK